MTDEGSPPIGATKNLLSDEVYQQIGNRIVTGELAPGQRIRDSELSLELHVSRMPVREALQRLERIGLVRMYPSRFTEVTEVTEAVTETSREFAAYQSGFVARMAAQRMTPEQRLRVPPLIEALLESAEYPLEGAAVRREFFDYLSLCSGNALQHMLMAESSLALKRNLRAHFADIDEPRRAAELRALGEALVAGDADNAEKLARGLHGIG